MKVHNKLARDRIPEVLAQKNIVCDTVTLEEQAYQEALVAKLQEEMAELIEAEGEHFVEEAADVLEVLHAMLKARGFEFAQVEKARVAKLAERGGFFHRLFLKTTRSE